MLPRGKPALNSEWCGCPSPAAERGGSVSPYSMLVVSTLTYPPMFTVWPGHLQSTPTRTPPTTSFSPTIVFHSSHIYGICLIGTLHRNFVLWNPQIPVSITCPSPLSRFFQKALQPPPSGVWLVLWFFILVSLPSGCPKSSYGLPDPFLRSVHPGIQLSNLLSMPFQGWAYVCCPRWDAYRVCYVHSAAHIYSECLPIQH